MRLPTQKKGAQPTKEITVLTLELDEKVELVPGEEADLEAARLGHVHVALPAPPAAHLQVSPRAAVWWRRKGSEEREITRPDVRIHLLLPPK